VNCKWKSRRRFYLLVRSRTPPISSEFRGGGGLNTPNPPSRYATGWTHFAQSDASVSPKHQILNQRTLFEAKANCNILYSFARGFTYLNHKISMTKPQLQSCSWPAGSKPDRYLAVHDFTSRTGTGGICHTVFSGLHHHRLRNAGILNYVTSASFYFLVKSLPSAHLATGHHVVPNCGQNR